MKNRRFGFASACVAVGCIASTILLGPASAEQSAKENDPDQDAVERIVDCLTRGKEAVLLSAAVECKEYRDGAKFLKKEDPKMPLNLNADQVCADSIDAPKDWRKLSGRAIKRIAAKHKTEIDPLGIRIFGAIFCESLDLAGVDLPYSLVIDNSLFARGFEARNFRTRGDFTFDGSRALDTVTITRSRIEGSIYGSDAYIKKLLVLDSEVQGSLIFRRSVLPEPAVFDTVSLSGELSVRQSALSYFFVQFSKIAGVLDLTGSQARCAYLIRKSEIGDLVVVDAGFGTSDPVSPQDPGPSSRFNWRLRPDSADSVKAATSASDSSTATDKGQCNFWTIALPGSFLVSDTRVRSSLCLRSFQWLAAGAGQQATSFVTFNDLNVGATTFIDLASSENKSAAEKRKFEAVGIKTNSLIFNFNIDKQISEMSVSGLGFEQVYAAEIQCTYDPTYSRPSGGVQRRLENISNPRSQLRLPQVNEVMALLNSNCLKTTQPFSTFVDAAQKAGNDDEAKQLRIERATKELSLRFQRVFGRSTTSLCEGNVDQSTTLHPSSVGALVSDVGAIVFGSLLWLVADHGYRPEKVGWFVVVVLLGAAVYFWLWVRIVGFAPEDKSTIRPVGLVFLFDRLLPAYKIREEHYNIESFYKRATIPARAESVGRDDLDNLDNRAFMKYLWFRIPVVKAEERDVRRAEVCLDVIKVVGLVLAIFLVAAVNALFSR